MELLAIIRSGFVAAIASIALTYLWVSATKTEVSLNERYYNDTEIENLITPRAIQDIEHNCKRIKTLFVNCIY